MKKAGYLPIAMLMQLMVWNTLALSCKNPAAEPLPYYNTAEFSPQFIPDTSRLREQVPHRIANFSFIDQDGRTVTQKTIEGKIHVANFFFSGCNSICPKMMANMKKISDAFKDNPKVALLSYSVTPWIDNPPRLKAYAGRNRYNSRQWHLLTGNKGEIYSLARTSYFAEESLGFTRDSSQFLHTEHLLLIDAHQRIRGIYNGTLELEAHQLVKDIRTLLSE